MGRYFQAVAIDYDGTLTQGGRPSAEILEAVEQARQAGLRAILVTGRILTEIRAEFPEVADHFDALVAENGAVLEREGVVRALTAPVPVALDQAMLERGIPFRRGQVLLACDGAHDVAIVEDLRRLGLDCQLSRNRGELMVLPPGVSKGSGVSEALSQLGLSRHSALAIGDAENDQSLLEACEIGVAVSNAVPSLKERADVVLAEPGERGVISLLGALVRDELRVEPRRWRVDLGRTLGGEPVTLPSSRVNVLITGGSGSGKSYAAGFLAERLISFGYSVCVFDPEGDHGSLGRLHDVVLVGGREALPSPEQLVRIIRQGLGSIVVDLSFAGPKRDAYLRDTLAALQKQRFETGVPHWIFLDEAHVPIGIEGLARDTIDFESKGLCMVTYRPTELCAGAQGCFDHLLVFPGTHGIESPIRESVAGIAGIGTDMLGPELTGVGLGQAVLVSLSPPAALRCFFLAPRWVAHVRHWHKYASTKLPPHQRFYFRNARGPTGVAAANLADFHHELRRCGVDVLRHHAAAGDFSRWIGEVIQDSTLTGSARSMEQRLAQASSAETEALRNELLEATELRYFG